MPSPDDSTQAKVKSLTSVLIWPALRRGGEEKENAREETGALKWPAWRQPITFLLCRTPSAHWPPGERGTREVDSVKKRASKPVQTGTQPDQPYGDERH
ncbi:hypothetical protein PAMP_023125 [Pampus punctatissimus]